MKISEIEYIEKQWKYDDLVEVKYSRKEKKYLN